jgi:hypothetical protein
MILNDWEVCFPPYQQSKPIVQNERMEKAFGIDGNVASNPLGGRKKPIGNRPKWGKNPMVYHRKMVI